MNADANAKAKPIHDHPFGEIPVDAKLLPIFQDVVVVNLVNYLTITSPA